MFNFNYLATAMKRLLHMLNGMNCVQKNYEIKNVMHDLHDLLRPQYRGLFSDLEKALVTPLTKYAAEKQLLQLSFGLSNYLCSEIERNNNIFSIFSYVY